MSRISGVIKPLILMWIFLPAHPVMGENPVSYVNVQNHRCLVSEPAHLSPDAPVVLILHGLGANANDLLPLCDELHLPYCRMVLPDAPLPLPESQTAHAWYDMATQSRADIENSRDYLFEVMDHFSGRDSKAPIPLKAKKPRPVIIMGFSQGGVMSLEAGLNYKGKIEAIVSMSGYMGEPKKTLANHRAFFMTPILLVHGTDDAIVPVARAHEAVDALRKAGYRPVLREFPMGHQITRDSILEVADFLQKVVAKNQPQLLK